MVKLDEYIKGEFKRLDRGIIATPQDRASLYTWTNIELLKTSIWDFKFGDNLFIEAQYSEDV